MVSIDKVSQKFKLSRQYKNIDHMEENEKKPAHK